MSTDRGGARLLVNPCAPLVWKKGSLPLVPGWEQRWGRFCKQFQDPTSGGYEMHSLGIILKCLNSSDLYIFKQKHGRKILSLSALKFYFSELDLYYLFPLVVELSRKTLESQKWKAIFWPWLLPLTLWLYAKPFWSPAFSIRKMGTVKHFSSPPGIGWKGIWTRSWWTIHQFSFSPPTALFMTVLNTGLAVFSSPHFIPE